MSRQLLSCLLELIDSAVIQHRSLGLDTMQLYAVMLIKNESVVGKPEASERCSDRSFENKVLNCTSDFWLLW
jgi:hypothetical protein